MVMFRQKLLCTLCLSMMAVGRVSSYHLEIYTSESDESNLKRSSAYQSALFTSLVQLVWCKAREEFFDTSTYSQITHNLPALDLHPAENNRTINDVDHETIVAQLGTHEHICGSGTRRYAQGANIAAAFDEAITNPAIDAAEMADRRNLGHETCCQCLYYGCCPNNSACNSDGHCTGRRRNLRSLPYDGCNLDQDIVDEMQKFFSIHYDAALRKFEDSALFSFLDDTTVHVDLSCSIL